MTLVSDSTYRISDLTALTSSDGSYELIIDRTGISDSAGNAGVGLSRISWLTDGAGTLQLSTLSGQVFEDHNANQTVDPDDQGLAGWTVFLDVNGNGQFDAGDVSQTTEASGRYAFSGLVAGAYQVGAVPPAGWQRSTPAISSGLYIASVSTGQTLGDLNFGYYLPAEINGILFNDLNNNGVRDDGEPGIEGGIVYLDLDSNGAFDPGEPTATADANGAYAFTGLVPGEYAIAQAFPSGWNQTFPGLGTTSSQTDAVSPTVDAASPLASQSLVVFDERCQCSAGTPTQFAAACL